LTAALLALAASVSWGVADFLGGLKSRTLPLLTVLAYAQPIGLVSIALVVAVSADPFPGGGVWWAALAALLGTSGIAAFYKGMAVGSMSIVAPVAATGAAIPVIAGVALGDRPSVWQLIGFPLAVGGVVLASREPARGLGPRVASGVPWAIVAAVGFGAYFLPMHAAANADFLWAGFVFRLSTSAFVLAALVALRPSLRVGSGDLAPLALIGTLDTGGNVLFAASASLGLVSVVSVLASLYPIVTVALAWLWLRERIDGSQAVGVAAALLGVLLIAAG